MLLSEREFNKNIDILNHYNNHEKSNVCCQQYCICVLLIKFPKTSMSILIPTEQLDDDKACLNKLFLMIKYFAAHYAKHFSIN